MPSITVCKTLALEFNAMFIWISADSIEGRSSALGRSPHIRPANQPETTVMRFSVNVPVLSEQMAVAPPIVSHAANTRTKLLSRIIFCAMARSEDQSMAGRGAGQLTRASQ